jgi:hypothetical protein
MRRAYGPVGKLQAVPFSREKTGKFLTEEHRDNREGKRKNKTRFLRPAAVRATGARSFSIVSAAMDLRNRKIVPAV